MLRQCYISRHSNWLSRRSAQQDVNCYVYHPERERRVQEIIAKRSKNPRTRCWLKWRKFGGLFPGVVILSGPPVLLVGSGLGSRVCPHSRRSRRLSTRCYLFFRQLSRERDQQSIVLIFQLWWSKISHQSSLNTCILCTAVLLSPMNGVSDRNALCRTVARQSGILVHCIVTPGCASLCNLYGPWENRLVTNIRVMIFYQLDINLFSYNVRKTKINLQKLKFHLQSFYIFRSKGISLRAFISMWVIT